MPEPGRARPEIVAHRGYSAVAPENTLVAIERAAAAGADAVEWDVQTAACGTPVLLHDVNLGRTTNGVGPVRRRSFAQLQALDAGRWFAPDFAGTRVPSLAEALAAVKGRVGRIYTEIKGYRELEDLDRMVSIVRKADMIGESVFISLDWGIVDRVGGQEPTLALGYLVDKAERFGEALERAAGDGRTPRSILGVGHTLLLEDPALVRRALDRGVEVNAWTVDDPAEADRLVAQGVTRLTTNQVETLLRWREARA